MRSVPKKSELVKLGDNCSIPKVVSGNNFRLSGLPEGGGMLDHQIDIRVFGRTRWISIFVTMVTILSAV
jgi:hypothetical protein